MANSSLCRIFAPELSGWNGVRDEFCMDLRSTYRMINRELRRRQLVSPVPKCEGPVAPSSGLEKVTETVAARQFKDRAAP